MNRDSQQYKDALYRFRKSMQRKTLESAKKDETISGRLTGILNTRIVFVYTYQAGRFFIETIKNERPKFIIPKQVSSWSTDDFLVAEEGLFEEYFNEKSGKRRK